LHRSKSKPGVLAELVEELIKIMKEAEAAEAAGLSWNL
jgi:hypothetical protein